MLPPHALYQQCVTLYVCSNAKFLLRCSLAVELASSGVDLIHVGGDQASAAAKRSTQAGALNTRPCSTCWPRLAPQIKPHRCIMDIPLVQLLFFFFGYELGRKPARSAGSTTDQVRVCGRDHCTNSGAHRWCWRARPDLGERRPSRLVATAEEDRLSI